MQISTKVNSVFFHYDIICIDYQKRSCFFINYYQRIRDLREDRDYTQKEIADYLEINQSDYSKYELGKHMMGIDKYIKLAKFYDVSLDFLTGLMFT